LADLPRGNLRLASSDRGVVSDVHALLVRLWQDGFVATSTADVVVRVAEQQDLLAVLRVLATDHPERESPIAASDLEQRTWQQMRGVGGPTVYLAESEGAAIGTATMMVMPNVTYECRPTAFIEAVVVSPGFRRRGVATVIIQRALEDAASLGCNKVQLLSHKRHADDGAHRLYTALGFEPEAEGFRIYLAEVPAAVRAWRAR
jgi:GNAT superfamily N-acetyltransferase